MRHPTGQAIWFRPPTLLGTSDCLRAGSSRCLPRRSAISRKSTPRSRAYRELERCHYTNTFAPPVDTILRYCYDPLIPPRAHVLSAVPSAFAVSSRLLP